MVNVNKKYLEEDFKNLIWENFVREIKSVKTRKNLDKVINKLLTPTEQVMIEKRLAILYLLEKGLSYRKIGETIDVTRNTISFVKNGFVKKKRPPKKSWRHPMLKKLDEKKPLSRSKFPTFTGKGRWRFLNSH